MIDFVKRWIGELLIDIGRKLIQSSHESECIRVRKSTPKNRYDW